MKTTIKLIAVISVIAITAFAKSDPNEIIIEAQVDGPSALHIKPNSIYWENGVNAKPGRANLLNEPTYVNGVAWTPKWKKTKEDRGSDTTTPYRAGLGTTDLKFEVVSVTLERGQSGIEERSAVVGRREAGEYVITIPDTQSGERWYKLVIKKQ